MKSKHILLFTGASTLFAGLTACSPKKQVGEDEKVAMNILYIMSDDHSYQTIKIN
jgi:hypothetical protein